MIEAFAAGGDFHSRTAVGMYPYIKEKVRKGRGLGQEEVGAVLAPLTLRLFRLTRASCCWRSVTAMKTPLCPWSKTCTLQSAGKQRSCLPRSPSRPTPVSFPGTSWLSWSRAHLVGAQVLNFSIAYGKTPMGLSKDFGVSVAEAKETLERWYADRPEVW